MTSPVQNGSPEESTNAVRRRADWWSLPCSSGPLLTVFLIGFTVTLIVLANKNANLEDLAEASLNATLFVLKTKLASPNL